MSPFTQPRQFQYTNLRGDPLQRCADNIGVIATRIVIVRENDDIGTTQIFRVFGFPFFCTTSATSRRHVPICERINLPLALDYKDRVA